MLDKSISKRPNIIQVVRYFENKKNWLNDFLLLISLKFMSSLYFIIFLFESLSESVKNDFYFTLITCISILELFRFLHFISLRRTSKYKGNRIMFNYFVNLISPDSEKKIHCQMNSLYFGKWKFLALILRNFLHFL